MKEKQPKLPKGKGALQQVDATVSMRTVADRMGVSVSTVSRALSGDPKISAETRKRIVAIANELGYRKNAVVTELMRGFRLRKSHEEYREVLAFLSYDAPRDWATNFYLEYYSQMMDGIRGRAENLGYRVDVFWLHEPGRSVARLGSILKARGIRGVILGPLPERTVLTGFPWGSFASVALGYMLETPLLHRVQVDMYENMSFILNKFMSAGCRRIGFVTHSKVEQRLGRLAEARYAMHQLAVPEAERIPILVTDKAEDPALNRWLRDYQPDAVVGQMDYVWPTLSKAKRRSGEPVCFAWLAAQRNKPDFGGMVPRHEAIGAAAFDLLVSLVAHGDNGIPDEPRSILIPGVWRKGNTVFAGKGKAFQ